MRSLDFACAQRKKGRRTATQAEQKQRMLRALPNKADFFGRYVTRFGRQVTQRRSRASESFAETVEDEHGVKRCQNPP
jgi:hypothetical protein